MESIISNATPNLEITLILFTTILLNYHYLQIISYSARKCK